MSFMYPRTASFHRPGAQSGVGAQPYGGATVSKETPVVTNVPCSIQERREGSNNTVGLPGDAQRPTWYVYAPKKALALGVVRERDIMIDDLGIRYQVIAPYVDSLGPRLTVATMEA